MRHEGQSPQYSSFAIVAIESVWPNPDGDEMKPDEQDLALLGEGVGDAPHKSQPRNGFEANSGVKTERDYHSKQGYYKILPLNILGLETTSTLNGSTFSVTFTLDDLLLVIPKGSANAFRHATGLPISMNDLVESDVSSLFPQLINPEQGTWEYVKEESLGLSRYRVTGANSSFNVEDLVDIGDTVTIWIYHEPQDFYLRTGEQNLFEGEEDTLHNVVGSADRKNQFQVSTRNFDDIFLFKLGLVNETIAQSVITAESEAVAYDQIKVVDQENLSDIITILSNEALSYADTNDNFRKTQVNKFVTTSFPSAGAIEQEYITYVISLLTLGTQQVITEEDRQKNRPPIRQEDKKRLDSLIDSLEVLEGGNLGFTDASEEHLEHFRNKNYEFSEDASFDDEKFLSSLNIIKNSLNDKAQEFAERYHSEREITSVKQNFTNGRRVLFNQAHGETPYLALKGVLSRVSSSVGTTEGSYTVTLSGEGYESVLTKNHVFYEDFLRVDVRFAPSVEFNSYYMNMSPSRAVTQMISQWAARQPVFGNLSPLSRLTLNRTFQLATPLNTEDSEESDGEENTDTFKPTPFPKADEKYLVRGTFFYRTYIRPGEENNPELLRIVTPINYLDTSRIVEMSRAVDLSYDDPAKEGSINTAVTLTGRTSIMDNLRKVAGTAHFYELFTDESGRFRYRFSFEAMERTPDTGYTPIIQDYDLLNSGNSFTTDDARLSTVVDVQPLMAKQTNLLSGLAFIGRSTYPPGKVPLEDVSPAPEESLAPENMRYGMRTLRVEDIYQSDPGGAKRKANLYHGFYGHPIKTASLRVRNNTSFRVGETVLVSLQKNKRRSRALIDLDKTIAWLKYIKEKESLLKLYVGVEKRFLTEGKESYIYTKGGDFLPIPDADGNMYSEYANNPHKFVADAFIYTLEFMKGALTGVNVVTPEYFPTTLWYYKNNPGNFKNWDQGNPNDVEIKQLYTTLMRASALNSKTDAEAAQNILAKSRNQGIINAIKFQNFRVASYYIRGVTHKFNHGVDTSTNLSLDFGQENLVLLEPRNFLPIGFLSIERKLKIGYDDERQNEMLFSPENKEELSSVQKLYVNQFEEDAKYKKASFLFSSQYIKNSSNYMYEMANIYEPFDSNHYEDSPYRSPSSESGTYRPETTNMSPSIESSSSKTTVRGESRTVVYNPVEETKTVTSTDSSGTSTTTVERLDADEYSTLLNNQEYERRRNEYILSLPTEMREERANLIRVYEFGKIGAGEIPDIREAILFVHEELGLTGITGTSIGDF